MPVARADTAGLGRTSCPNEQTEQPFAPFGDPASYALVPGGSFESDGPAWNTSGSTQLVTDNEPWGAGSQAISLSPGSSVTSPATCIGLLSPTMRFFARSTGGSPSSSLQVSVTFKSVLGLIDTLPVGSVQASDAWEPTPQYLLVINALSLLPGYRLVAFQFTPAGDANWEIDDVYVDPWSKG
ncbi:MAG TPA: hypothetical protein VGF93_08335 [Solirubrobacteraceae bacterium]